MLAELRDGLHAVGGLADDLKTVDHVEQRHKALAHDVMIFHDQYADRSLGSALLMLLSCSLCVHAGRARRSRTVVPAPGSLVTSSVPPMAAARSRMPVRP